MEKEETTPTPEVTESEETVNDTTQDETTVAAEATIGDLQTDVSEKPAPSKSDNIPKARLDKEIRRRKELEAELAELKAVEADDYDDTDVSQDKSDLETRLAKIEEKERFEKLNATVRANIEKALEDAPEFKNVVNKDVLAQMAMNPANSKKTYSQLLEEVYGNTISGTRTVETTTPRGGAQGETLDLARAGTDNEYLKTVLADPVLKAQYNKDLEQRIML